MIRTLCSMIAAITLTAALGACASTPERAPLSRDIGPAPSYLREVPVPAARAGDSVLVDAERKKVALGKANRIICEARNEWEATRQSMLQGQTRSAARACAATAARAR